MSDPTNSTDPRVENQDGAVRDVDDPEVQQDTVSGGAPDDPNTPDDAYAADDAEEPDADS